MMAPYLILSDIHGNYEALEAVLEDARGRYDRIVCLGDLVGYGADPNRVAEWARANVVSIVRGNHDRACTGTDLLEYFNPSARSLGTVDPRRAHAGQFELSGAPCAGPAARDTQRRFRMAVSTWYTARRWMRTNIWWASRMFSSCASPGNEADVLRPYAPAGRLSAGPTEREALYMPDRELQLEPDYYYLINPGSVGQPRDGDPRAAYALYSPDDRTVKFGRVPYDIGKAAAKILQAELPESLAMRLFEGM